MKNRILLLLAAVAWCLHPPSASAWWIDSGVSTGGGTGDCTGVDCVIGPGAGVTVDTLAIFDATDGLLIKGGGPSYAAGVLSIPPSASAGNVTFTESTDFESNTVIYGIADTTNVTSSLDCRVNTAGAMPTACVVADATHVVGPTGSITDNSIPVYDGTTGELLKGGGPTYASGVIAGPSVLKLSELASAPTGAAGTAQVWTKNETGDTNSLHFTQGDGNDDIVMRLAGAGGTGHAQGVVFARETGTGGAGTDTTFKYDWTNHLVTLPALYLSVWDGAGGSSLGGDGLRVYAGADPPATCVVGDIFIDEDTGTDVDCTTSFSGSICRCTATDTWTAEASLTADVKSSGTFGGGSTLKTIPYADTADTTGKTIKPSTFAVVDSGSGTPSALWGLESADGGGTAYFKINFGSSAGTAGAARTFTLPDITGTGANFATLPAIDNAIIVSNATAGGLEASASGNTLNPTTGDMVLAGSVTVPTATHATALIIPSGTDPGATCTVGSIYMDTDTGSDTNCATGFDGALCRCKATNTWVGETTQ